MDVSGVLDRIIGALAIDMVSCPAATFKEGRVNTVAAAALLGAGFKLIECYPSTKIGMEIWMEGNALLCKGCALPMRPVNDGEKQDRPDLRITNPPLHLEFKVIPKFGAKAMVSVKSLNKDVEKLLRKTADVLVFCADDKMYDQARGAKRDPRGRPRESVALLDAILPAIDDLTADVTHRITCLDERFNCAVRRVPTPFGFERMVVAVLLSHAQNPAIDRW